MASNLEARTLGDEVSRTLFLGFTTALSGFVGVLGGEVIVDGGSSLVGERRVRAGVLEGDELIIVNERWIVANVLIELTGFRETW